MREHSPRDVADRAETVLGSLPSLQASTDVATGADGVIAGTRIRRFVDLSTVGSTVAQHNRQQLAARDIAAPDAPVSGGVSGAANGTLAVMVPARARRSKPSPRRSRSGGRSS